MRALLDRPVAAPAIAVMGVWDPVLPVHRQLFAEVIAHAHARNRAALAILLDPDPRWLLYGPARWPVYDDGETRRRLLRAVGFDAVLGLLFEAADIHGGAAEVFDRVTRQVRLEELWLGANQRLGSGDGGSASTVQRVAAQHHVALRRLPDVATLPQANQVRGLLAQGRVTAAAAIVGHPPARRQPPDGTLRFAWSPGIYRAAGTTSDAAVCHFVISLEAKPDGLAAFSWPQPTIRQLEFIAGPGEEQEVIGGDIELTA